MEHGAATVVVPGVIPVGCAPPVLATFADPDPAGYDPRTGCLRAINEVAIRHNALLQDGLRELRARHAAAAAVVYVDFFGPVIDMVTSPAKFGELAPASGHPAVAAAICMPHACSAWRWRACSCSCGN